MTTFFVQVQLNATGQFEDVYVRAASPAKAIEAAKKVSALYRDAGVQRRWISFAF